jgi:pyridinium-3,5-biscarboxylic acid mononucleotide sulfurtransferase
VSAVDKERSLALWLGQAGSVLVGYSGGVDSAYLACVALEALGSARVLAVIGHSASYPESQWATAQRVAGQFGIPVLVVETDEMNDRRYAANPTNRCYYCKTELWDKLGPIARERGLAIMIDGTNADDLRGHRPGAAAGREHGVESPLAIVGLTKPEIRERSRARGIPTWDQPSSPCLASRIPHGTPVTVQRLRTVEAAERGLREIGVVGDLRVRHHGAMARVEIDRDELGRWLMPANRAVLEDVVRRAGYESVTVDPAGYRTGGAVVPAGDQSGGTVVPAGDQSGGTDAALPRA